MKKFGESYLQQQAVRWFKLTYPRELIFSIPNEGIRSAKTAGRMKAEGMRAGVADLQLIIKGKMPLFVEMKHGNNGQSESQKVFQQEVEELGCRYVVCRTLDSFMNEVEDYLSN